MYLLNNLTNDASQQLLLTGIPGVQATMTLQFKPRIAAWIMGIEYKIFSVQGLRVVASPNMLRKWKNILPFGMACVRSDGLDPYQQGDFLNGIASLYLLDTSDVAVIEAQYFA